MDALAGYGSDSSSSEVGEERKNALSGLLGSASEESSDEEQPPQGVSSSGGGVQPPPSKRLKLSKETKVTQQPPKFVLREPPLFTQNHKSMIYWNVDYLRQEPMAKEGSMTLKTKTTTPTPTPTIATASSDLAKKLHHLATTLKVSWADHLKSQHEFHNPYFFESVVEHFGIASPLGSQIPVAQGGVPELKDYEIELFPRRETAATPSN